MTAAPSQPSSSVPIAVAGIGASAGGLAATTQLLRGLGGNPGLAVIVVHHLDRVHESNLAEILARTTSLPVRSVSDGMAVEPNGVYVAPPNASVGIAAGVLHLTPRPEGGGLHLPIDRCFESLAADPTIHPIGIVLTGTGSDGARGVQAIRASGGSTFAQDASAEYKGMPESAIATGCIDFVLSPEAIARELIRIAAGAPATGPDGEPDLRRILLAMRKASGIDFANYKQTTVRRRVQRRIAASGSTTLAAYADLVERTPTEARALCDDVLIHVTSFFRDPEAFQALKTTVFPRLVENRPRDAHIRIWVAGCSTGEEVYSIAISLLEFLGDMGASDLPVRLFGTDVSASAIEVARAGKYPVSIEQHVSPGRLERFFIKLDGTYQIRKDVRDLCIFALQNATLDPPFAGMDLVSCRNLMIYLGVPLQDRILPIFHYALKDAGFLMLGAAETVRSFPGFVPIDVKNKIYARSAAAPRKVVDFREQWSPLQAPSEASEPGKPGIAQDVNREVDRLVLAEFAPPGVVVTGSLAIVQFRGRTGPFLDPAAGVASFDLLRMVKEELRLPLRQTIDEARTKKVLARRRVPGRAPGASPDVVLEVIPFRVASAPEPYFVVLFRELAAVPAKGGDAGVAAAPGEAAVPEDQSLVQELTSTRNYLQSVVEQLEAANEELRAANEEIVSSNEELRSTNEELQMAKEELQATNEELGTVNDEMRARNLEATRLGDDLTNVLTSVDIPIVILGRDSRVRRFTPAAVRIFRLLPGDLGRPIGDITALVRVPELPQMIADVLARLIPVTCKAQDEAGQWYEVGVRPYATLDNRIDGTVITAVDIDAVTKGSAQLTEARRYAESIVDTIREALVVINEEGRIRSANRTFLRMWGVTARDIEGLLLDELGRGAWDLPALRKRLGELGEGGKLEGYRMEREVEGGGHRILVLNARRFEHTPLTLMAMEDVTEKEEIERNLRDYQAKLGQMALDAAVAEERERRRIAVDVHDHIGQSLALAQIKMSSLRGAVDGTARVALDESLALLVQVIADIRTLVFELSPPLLYDLGLKDGLSWLIEELGKRHSAVIELDDDGVEKPFDEPTVGVVYRSVRELLANVLKHARAPRTTVALRRIGDEAEITVADSGVGFDPIVLDQRSSSGGFGLFSVREQIGRLGGKVEVASAPGQGTRVTLRVPLKVNELAARLGREEGIL